MPGVRVQVLQGKTLRLGSARLHTFWRHNVTGVHEERKAEGQRNASLQRKPLRLRTHTDMVAVLVCVVLHCDTLSTVNE